MTVQWSHDSDQRGRAIKTFEDDNDNEPEAEAGPASDDRSGALLSGKPLHDCDHGELLRLIIGEGAEAAMDTFIEAKDPDIDPALKLKLIGLASQVGDNFRKAIATQGTHFGGQG